MSLFGRKPRSLEFGAVLVEIAKLELGPNDILVTKVPSTGSNRRDQEVCQQLSRQLRSLYLPRVMTIVGDAELLVVKGESQKDPLCVYCEKVGSDKCLGGHEICEYAKHG